MCFKPIFLHDPSNKQINLSTQSARNLSARNLSSLVTTNVKLFSSAVRSNNLAEHMMESKVRYRQCVVLLEGFSNVTRHKLWGSTLMAASAAFIIGIKMLIRRRDIKSLCFVVLSTFMYLTVK